ncbi:hypothetical protein KJ657_02480, partial [Patescibacteria group bacterium]|nr:hypothetical protein [Patescibacteria group bacterium]MBU1685492.1 hypothetical protein [Patescibacteria group bacterium]
MKVPSRKKTERTKQVFLRKVIGPFLVILFILAGFLFSVSNQDPYTRTRAQESETEMVESVKSENTIATEGETEELTEESISEDIPLDDQSQTDSADLKEPTEAAELEVAVEGEGDDLQKIVEEESIINEEELFDCVEIEIPAEPVEAEEEIIEAAAAVAEEVSYEEEIVEEVIDRPIEEESAAVDEDVAEGTAEEEIEGPAEERPVKEKVADEGEGDEEALIEEVTEVPVEEEVTEVAEEVIEEEIVEEEIVEYEEVEILREGKLFRCKRKMPATESAVVAEEQEEEVAEIIQDVEEKKAILEGVLIKEGDNFAEENEVSKIKLAEVEIEGKILGDEVSLNEAVEALVGLTTTEQDIEKAVIRSVLRQKDNNIAAAVLQDKKTEGLIRQNAKKALLETLENKVGKTIGRKTVQELIATDLKDDPEIKDVINLMVTDDLKMELIRRTVKNNLQEEGIELEDDVKELIKNDYNKFVLEELMGEKLKKKESTQAILVDAVGAEEEVAEEKPIIPVIKVMARGPAGTIQIPIENLRFEAGSVVMIVDPIRQFAPGVYQIEVEINNPITGRTETILQDFAWGVLAINTGKDIYQPGDLAAINIGVLDDQGWPVCDAEVVLEIKSPSDSIGYPKVENTGNCEIFNSLNTKPDYRAEYTFSQEGKYVLKLSATLPNGKTRTMTSSVKVVRIPDFVIYRSAATRLYPVGISPMSIDVYFYRDFEGYISDVVPGDFQINSMESTGSAVSTNGEINTTDGSDVKLITWQVKAKSGNVQSFRYFYDAPDISPQFYTIGPLNSSGTLYEKRKWQIANDEPRIAADTEGDLLGHWKFNTGSGSTAIDSSTYGNDGTLTNMEAGDWSTDTPTGMNDDPYSLDFDGSNEYVTVSDPVGGELDFTYEDDFSITGWFNRADDGVYRTILAKRNGTSTSDVGYVVSILAETDELLFEVSDGDDRYEMRSSTTFTSASGWNHFAIVWDQDSAANSKIYINGTDDSETHSGTIDDIGDLANSLAVNIAAESDAEAPFYGKLDDIRIYDRVLTADEVSVLAGGNAPGGISSDLQLWLRADAGVTTSGSDVTDWADQSGNGNDASQATTTNQPDLLTDNLNYNPVIDFDGVDNFMSISGGLFGTATHSELNVYEVKRINTVKQSYSFTEWVSTGLVSAHMPWSDNNIYWDGGGTSGNYRLSAAWGGTVTEPYIWSMSYSTSGATPDGNNQDISRNGLSIGNDATATSFTGTGSDFYLNSNAYGSAYFEDSSRAEFIVYTGSITATENQKIESYLAIKYGITIDQSDASGGIDYIDSSGTTVWAQDTSDTFENDISGIGQDDTSSLNQTQSKSSDSDGILRVADATAMDDLDFFTWSNNNGTASWTMTGAPAGYEILSRQWRSYVYLATKDVETVDFEFDVADTDFNVPAPVSGTTYYFVYDKDKDGNLDDECLSTGSCATTGGVIAMNDSGSSGDDTADDNKWTAQADFPEEAATYTQIKFTLATEFPYPGGVNSNLEMWLRADSNSVSQSGNGTAATDWTDLSSNAYLFDRTISGIGGSDPTWYSSLINGNPAVSFSATTDRLGISSFSGMPTGDLWIATVYQDEDSNDEWIWTYGANDCSVRLEADGSFATYYGDNPLYSSAANGDDGKPHILTMRRTGTTFTQVLDNLQIGTESNSDTPAASQCIMLGERMSTNCVAYGTSSDFEGDIAEIIAYDNYPSVTDQKKINSYLAIKYGIPLDQTTPTDYLDSDGNTIWDSSETTYNHDIVGIGQDDDSGLDQTSTKYEDTENILQISEADSQDDLDFLTWAHNDGDRLWTSTDAPAGYQILERQWQFQETGDIGGFDIEFDVRDVH